MKNLIRAALRFTVPVVAALLAPFFALVARSGYGIEVCRRFGFHPVRLHYYQPIPRYEEVSSRVFDEPGDFPGFPLDMARIRGTLEKLGRFGAEASWPREPKPAGEYTATNDNFGFGSAALLHTFIRAHGTRKVVEVGGGYSSLISLAALETNHGRFGFEFVCVEPHPKAWLEQAIAGVGSNAKLIRQPAEQLDPAMLADLRENDILFIDSSHCVRLASDVNFLFLQVIPRLRPGVIVHIHDIYIPYEYPRSHFFGPNKLFWNEQYLLQALLTDNLRLAVILPAFMAQKEMAEAFAAAFPHFDPGRDRKSSSFWIQRE